MHLRHRSLFVGFAPADDPQIVVAVAVEGGGYGASTAAPIARAIFDAWLLGKLPAGLEPIDGAVPAVVAATAACAEGDAGCVQAALRESAAATTASATPENDSTTAATAPAATARIQGSSATPAGNAASPVASTSATAPAAPGKGVAGSGPQRALVAGADRDTAANSFGSWARRRGAVAEQAASTTVPAAPARTGAAPPQSVPPSSDEVDQ